jgi:hypothetical protein
MSTPNIERLQSIKTLASLVTYLHDELDWPIEAGDVEDITFDYSPSELGIDEKSAVRIKEIKQLRPLTGNQPWGIFFVNFEKKRLPVVVMRLILRALVFKKRTSANKSERQAWQSHDLLFISAYGEDTDRAITFAHFVENPGNNLAELRVLGWDDDDTPLHMDYVARMLQEKLTWDDNVTSNPDAWRARWADAFLLRHRFVITKSDELAEALAVLARRLRTRIRSILRMEDGFGEIRKLQRAFKAGLIHDLDDDGFADMFAQTVTYGLFSASVRRTFPGEGTAITKDDVPNLIFTSPFLKEMLGIFLGIKSRKGTLDFDELGVSDVTDLLTSPDTHMEVVLADFNNKTRGEDPVIHFYEHFLSAYNKQLKIQRGVFYTPQPVVSYIVRSVHELLQTEFGLIDGLADTTTWGVMLKKHPEMKLPLLTDEPGEKRTISLDEPFVQILDPATGTATFLVEVIDVIHSTLVAKWKQQHLSDAQQRAAWNDYVPQHLLPRLYAFELMMAPYAIAHMKIGLKLAETGYSFITEERARIYLTNALEPKVKQLPQIGFDALAHEAAAVNEVKWYKRFTVVIGNPPYSLVSANMEPAHRTLVERYKFINGAPLRERGALQLEKILNDDYVKFIAKTQDFLTAAGAGLVGLITNHAYLDNPTMRGLRYSFLASFKQYYFYDLGGSAKKVGENTDENVFDIQQGVAICITVKSDHNLEPVNNHARLLGVRDAKYKVLGQTSVKDTVWGELSPSPPYYLFVPTDYGLRSEYEQFIPLPDVFQLHSIGCFTSKDHFVISRNTRELVANAKAFRDSSLPDKELCKSLEINPKDAWDVSRSREQLRRLSDGDIAKRVLRFIHRPFDLKHIFFHRSLVWSLAYPVNRNLMKSGNLALVTSRQLATPPWNHVFCSNAIVEMFLMSNKTKEGNHVFPLYVLPDEDAVQRSLGDEARHPNYFAPFLKKLSSQLHIPQNEMGLPTGLIPEDIFNYIYAVFHSADYRTRYAEFLKIDFPRLPLTENLELFHSLARLGGDLITLHLLESTKLSQPITELVGGKNLDVEKISWSKNTVWVDKAQTIGFKGVREKVWNFHIGGYQVCEKWLKDRKGWTLAKDDIDHYHKIVVAISETIRLMAEIDQVIEKHGGWPGAFKTQAGTDSAIVEMSADTPEEIPDAAENNVSSSGVQSESSEAEAISEPDSSESDEAADESQSESSWREDPQANIIALRRVITSAGVNGMPKDDVLRAAASELGWERLGPSLRQSLEGALIAASRRGVLATSQDHCSPICKNIGEFNRDFLKTQFLAALGTGWHFRGEVYQQVARFLGFARTGPTIRETLDSVIRGLLLEKRLEQNDGYLRRAQTEGDQLKKPGNIQFSPLKNLDGRRVVFTGKLPGMVRSKAIRQLKRAGGIFQREVASNTDIIVVGEDSPNWEFSDAGKKIAEAERLNKEGDANVRYITADCFFRLIAP